MKPFKYIIKFAIIAIPLLLAGCDEPESPGKVNVTPTPGVNYDDTYDNGAIKGVTEVVVLNPGEKNVYGSFKVDNPSVKLRAVVKGEYTGKINTKVDITVGTHEPFGIERSPYDVSYSESVYPSLKASTAKTITVRRHDEDDRNDGVTTWYVEASGAVSWPYEWPEPYSVSIEAIPVE